ncbi:MAG TPA: biotin/lipoyl-containing protein [bacterium]
MGELTLHLGDRAVTCDVEREGDDVVVRAGGVAHRVQLSPLGAGMLRVRVGGHSAIATVARQGERWYLHLDGHTLEYRVAPGERRAPRASGAGLVAPMPGLVTQVLAGVGDSVTAGQPLVIIEAMKMEHVIRASLGGRIRAINVRSGDQIEGGTVVVEMSPAEGAGGRAP